MKTWPAHFPIICRMICQKPFEEILSPFCWPYVLNYLVLPRFNLIIICRSLDYHYFFKKKNLVASSSSSEAPVPEDDVDNEIAEINSSKDEAISELQRKLDQANKRIQDLSDQNSHFRRRITQQAQELAQR